MSCFTDTSIKVSSIEVANKLHSSHREMCTSINKTQVAISAEEINTSCWKYEVWGGCVAPTLYDSMRPWRPTISTASWQRWLREVNSSLMCGTISKGRGSLRLPHVLSYDSWYLHYITSIVLALSIGEVLSRLPYNNNVKFPLKKLSKFDLAACTEIATINYEWLMIIYS